MHRPVAINVIASMILKAVGLLYSFAIIGMAARHIPLQDTSELLLAFSFLAPLGLVQAGMGPFVLRAVIHSHARTGSIAQIPEIGMSFRLMTIIAVVALGVIIFLVHRAGLDFAIPTITLMLAGTICSVADQTWIGTERAWVVNICLAMAFVVLGSLFAIMQLLNNFNLLIIAIVTYGAPALASIFAFCARVVQKEFRTLLMAPYPGSILDFLRLGLPTFLVSLGSSGLIFLPTAAIIWPALPNLAADEIPLLRLCTIGASTIMAMLVPLLPTLIVAAHRQKAVARIRMARLWTLGILGFVVSMVPILYMILPTFLQIWIGLKVTDVTLVLPWSIALALWMGAAISGQLSLMTCNPLAVAVVVAACDTTILLLMVSGALGASVSVVQALICGLAVHMALALLLIQRQMARSPS